MKQGALPAPLRPAEPVGASPHRALPARLFHPPGCPAGHDVYSELLGELPGELPGELSGIGTKFR